MCIYIYLYINDTTPHVPLGLGIRNYNTMAKTRSTENFLAPSRVFFFYNEVRSVRNIIQFTITYIYIYVHHITYIGMYVYNHVYCIWTTYFSGAKFC